MDMENALLILLLAIPAAYATQYTVGDTSGWSNFRVDYNTWVTGKTFTVGDTLLFNYGPNQQVSHSCSLMNAPQTYSDGSTTIPLSKAGPMYFICPVAGHYSIGMKLSITVVVPGTPSPATPSCSTILAAGIPEWSC